MVNKCWQHVLAIVCVAHDVLLNNSEVVMEDTADDDIAACLICLIVGLLW